MATLEQLELGLRKADAAGNVEDAKAFAAEIQRMRTQAPAPEAPAAESGIPGPRQTRAWSEIPKEAIMAAPGSLGKFVMGMVDTARGTGRNLLETILPERAFNAIDVYPLGGEEASAVATGAADIPRGLRQQVLRAVLGDKAAMVIDAATAAPMTAATVAAAGNVPKAVVPALGTAERAGKTGEATIEHYKGYLDPEVLKERLATDPVAVAADISMLAGALKPVAAKAPAIESALGAVSTYTNPLTPVMAAGRAGVNALASGTEFVRNYMDPGMTARMDAADGRARAIIERLRANRQYVEGSQPTAAQAAVEAGSPKYAALGESAAQVLPAEFQARKLEQAAARAKALGEGVAGTPEELAALIEQREAKAAPLYRQAERQVIPEDAALSTLLQRPSMDVAMRRARQLAAEKDVPFQIGETVPERTVATNVLDANGNPVTQTIPGTTAQYPVKSLHFIKQAMDDLIKNPERFGIGATEAGAIKQTRGQFLSWLEDNAPTYAEARGTYKAGSTPINQREVGQYLQSKLISPLSEEAPQRANAFAEAVRNAPATLKRSVEGTQRFSSLDQILSPDQISVIDNIRLDLAREAQAKQQATAGRATAPTLNKLASEAEPGARLPNMMSRVTNVANRILGALERKIDKKLAIEIATEMLNPETAAIALERSLAKSEAIAAQGARIRGRGEAGINALRAPGVLPIVQLQNIMAERQNNNAMAR